MWGKGPALSDLRKHQIQLASRSLRACGGTVFQWDWQRAITSLASRSCKRALSGPLRSPLWSHGRARTTRMCTR